MIVQYNRRYDGAGNRFCFRYMDKNNILFKDERSVRYFNDEDCTKVIKL